MENYDLCNVHYAGDLWLALQAKSDVVNAVLLELDKFSKFSGLMIKYEKSIATKVGPHRDTEARYYTMKKLFWSDGAFRILGIDMHPDWEIMHELNYGKLIEKTQSILGQWLNQKSSLLGKICIINSLIISLFVFPLMSLPSPKASFFDKFKQVIMNYMWENKPARVRYDKLIQDRNDGGLRLTDLKTKDTSLKAAWLSRWARQNRLNSAELGWIYSNLPVRDARLWECNLSECDIRNLYPTATGDMGVQVLLAWAQVTYTGYRYCKI